LVISSSSLATGYRLPIAVLVTEQALGLSTDTCDVDSCRENTGPIDKVMCDSAWVVCTTTLGREEKGAFRNDNG
jgi:hypothetical protein